MSTDPFEPTEELGLLELLGGLVTAAGAADSVSSVDLVRAPGRFADASLVVPGGRSEASHSAKAPPAENPTTQICGVISRSSS